MSVSPTVNRLNPPPVPEMETLACTLGCILLNSSATASEIGPTVLEPSISIAPLKVLCPVGPSLVQATAKPRSSAPATRTRNPRTLDIPFLNPSLLLETRLIKSLMRSLIDLHFRPSFCPSICLEPASFPFPQFCRVATVLGPAGFETIGTPQSLSFSLNLGSNSVRDTIGAPFLMHST